MEKELWPLASARAGNASVDAGLPFAGGIGGHGALELALAHLALAPPLVPGKTGLGPPSRGATLDGLWSLLRIHALDGGFARNAHLDVLR